ncbi:unnamed protein product [marine sediment metagenome]|uniref:Uncharacterized protein n=1 Tax=marine sediment metagenome TaxID=412755 RepID=X1QPC7_9ZZZZ
MKEIHNVLLELEDYLKPYVTYTKPRTSRRNVQHLVVEAGEVTYSIMYFRKTNTWRIFYPYPSSVQTKFDVPTFGHVIEYFQLGASDRIIVRQ